MSQPRSAKNAFALGLLALLLALSVVGRPTAASAQDDGADETPTPTPENRGIPIPLDNVVRNPDGTISYTVDNDSEIANLPTPTSRPGTIPPADGAEGTGTIGSGKSDDQTGGATGGSDTAGTDTAGSDTDGRTISEGSDLAQSGQGNKLLMFGAIAAALASIAMVGMVFLRRKDDADEAPELEEAILPLDDPATAARVLAGYQGAQELGAYERGGAAYAQHVEGTTPIDVDRDRFVPSGRIASLHHSMVQVAEKTLADGGRDKIIGKRLEAAGSKMRPGEWLVMAIGGTVAAMLISWFILGLLMGVLLTAIVAYGFWAALSYQADRRSKAFAEGLPETLGLLAGSLRGGTSLLQAIQTVADEADEPTAGEFQRILTESRLGRDIGVSFRDVAKRMDSPDFEWVVTAIEIHREVGGDLAGILDRVSATIRARNRVRGQVAALSAEGKLSGLVLFVLPPGMVGMIALINREYLNEMITTGEGQVMLVVATLLLLMGGAWLKRLSRFVY